MRGMLTLTIITQRATSLNYGENIGNVSILKKLSLGDNSQITYVSDKALKYDIRRKGKEEKGWRLLDEKVKELIEKSKDGKKLNVDKFAKELVQEYQEFDLFGGLLTNLKGADGKKVELSYGDSVKRTAPVKVTYAYSISKFQGDMDFMNNIEAYNRYIRHIEQKDAQVITQSEQHTAHYYYTIAIDLDRIGVWETENGTEEVIPAEEKAKRVKDLLDIIRTLSRQIRGRYENLSPIFVIGGIYKAKNPFFMGCIGATETEDGKLLLDVNRLLDCKGIIPEEERDNTLCGLLSGFFANEQEIREKLYCKSVGEVFEALKNKVGEIYGVPTG
ncbi:type I-B CRISPR-associated protein Cas7/Cst2/DevR [Thermocrinis sp.]|jgi:CRISPR-associated protein Cst2|uniref:type I-B CRISPR-associated protein Cas7/Cst2/DevR n=1 Tax=Thermocrinis sp. TaxID=2024383 RepID=UPI00262E5453|nr:type I-B CRISPR-associated protein Cas7/Cst2/DevR [Thermocrinis sp.]